MKIQTRYFWHCPNGCGYEDITKTMPKAPFGGGAARLHACPKVLGVLAPLVIDGTRAKVTAVLREDYVGSETVQLSPDGRKPIMSVVTERDDGQDVIVFAPLATGSGRSF